MDKYASRFWGTDYDHNPSLTDDRIREVESILGVTLPLELVSLLKVQNGGYTQGFVFPTNRRTSWAEDHVPFDELFGIGNSEGPSGIHNILNSAYMTVEWGLPQRQILLAGDGHWWIALDYRGSSVPAVAWIDVEMGEEVRLANSFKEFLEALLPCGAVDGESGLLKAN